MLLDFTSDGIELFAFIDIWHVFGEDMNAGLFENGSGSGNFVLKDLVGFWNFGDEELICLGFDKKVLIDLLSSEGFRLYDFTL